MLDYSRLERTRDLSLPEWGPYSKDSFALSHIADPAVGRLFECIFIPGIHAERIHFPDKRDSWNVTPVAADRDLGSYQIRFLMDPDCQADVTVTGVWPDRRLATIDFQNGGPREIAFRLDFALGFQKEDPITELDLAPGESFLPAHRYASLNRSLPSTGVDQCREGTIPSGLFVERLALGPAFTAQPGARAEWNWPLPSGMPAGRLAIRYAFTGSKPVHPRLFFGGKPLSIQLAPTGPALAPGALRFAELPFPGCDAGSHPFALELPDGTPDGELFVDGFFLLQNEGDPASDRRIRVRPFEPNLERHVEDDFFALRSPLSPDRWYGVCVTLPQSDVPFHVWKFSAGDPAAHYRRLGSVSRYWTRDRIFDRENEHLVGDLRPLLCPAGSTLTLRAAIGFADSPTGLRAKLRETLDATPAADTRNRNKSFHASRPEFQPSLQAVIAAAYTTVCYPQDFLSERVKYFTPGAFFPTLYQWDAGIQSLGLVSHDPQRSLENINAYLPLPDDPKPLVLHGSVLPTQPFAWWEIYQRTGDVEVLRSMYPKMRRYYRFMAGKEDSLMDLFGTGLLCPWPYFYNSAGWDDYPAQAHVAEEDLGRTMSPVANTAYTARVSKIMALAASALDLDDDVAEYERDASRFLDALLQLSWDDRSGYFGYVIDETKEHLRAPDGSNFNCGLDGVSPLVAGLPPGKIRDTLLGHCRDERRLWTRIGLSTVDQSASYFSNGGYWNGSVWIAHQWFFFKAFLDCGEFDLALRLARAVADAWKNAVASHRGQTFEALHIATERGIGTPHFSALALPVIPLYEAVFEAGRLTGGFDTLCRKVEYDPNNQRLTAEVANPHAPGPSGFLAVMGEPGTYSIQWRGETFRCQSDEEGCLGFTLETTAAFESVVISRS